MHIEAACEKCKCKETGDWEVGFFDNLKEARNRPEGWACIVMKRRNGRPINVPSKYKEGVGEEFWANPEFCEKHNTDVAVFCPKCFRVEE
jgi:hypothetical protein